MVNVNYVIIGNAVALLASIVMVYAGILKDKKQILFAQTVQCGLFILSNIILGGISGAIVNFLGCIRNVLCYKGRLGIFEIIILTILSVGLTVIFNDLGIIGLLPMISTVSYIFFMNTKSIVRFKFLVIFTTVLWLIYDIFIRSYTSALFDLFCVITNTISLIQISCKKND